MRVRLLALAALALAACSPGGGLFAQQQVDTTVSVTPLGDTVTTLVFYTTPPAPLARVDSVRTLVKRLFVKPDTVWVEKPAQPLPDVKPAPPLGIMFGPFHLPLSKLNDTVYGFTGTVRYGYKAATLAAQLDTAAKRGAPLGFAPTAQRAGFIIPGSPGKLPVFSTQRWRDTFDVTWGSSNATLRRCFSEGRCRFVYVIDEPNCSGCWWKDTTYGKLVIRPAQVDSLACHVKLRLGDSALTAVRTTPDWFLQNNYRPKCLDITWAQYDGKYHVPSAGQTPQQFAAKQVADAKALGVGIVLGANVLDGGNGPCVKADSGVALNGTFYPDPNLTDGLCRPVTGGSYYRYQMSAYEYENAYTVFLKEPYTCASFGWKWTDSKTTDGALTDRAAIQAYFTQLRIIAASKRLSVLAKARNPGVCRRTP